MEFAEPAQLGSGLCAIGCAKFVISHMVWLRHQNIRYIKVRLDLRQGGSVVRAPGICLRGPGFNPALVTFSTCACRQAARVT